MVENTDAMTEYLVCQVPCFHWYSAQCV